MREKAPEKTSKGEDFPPLEPHKAMNERKVPRQSLQGGKISTNGAPQCTMDLAGGACKPNTAEDVAVSSMSRGGVAHPTVSPHPHLRPQPPKAPDCLVMPSIPLVACLQICGKGMGECLREGAQPIPSHIHAAGNSLKATSPHDVLHLEPFHVSGTDLDACHCPVMT